MTENILISLHFAKQARKETFILSLKKGRNEMQLGLLLKPKYLETFIHILLSGGYVKGMPCLRQSKKCDCLTSFSSLFWFIILAE